MIRSPNHTCCTVICERFLFFFWQVQSSQIDMNVQSSILEKWKKKQKFYCDTRKKTQHIFKYKHAKFHCHLLHILAQANNRLFQYTHKNFIDAAGWKKEKKMNCHVIKKFYCHARHLEGRRGKEREVMKVLSSSNTEEKEKLVCSSKILLLSWLGQTLCKS